MNNQKPNANNWRRQGQERFLFGKKLFWRDYCLNSDRSNHDHCEFCGAKFSCEKGDLENGYATEDGYHWICKKCFEDFETEFCWKVGNYTK